MNKIVKIMSIACLLFAAAGCGEDKQFINLNDDNAPGPVTGIKVERLPGAAKITYSLPGDESLRYVRAEYSIRPGEMREAKSSNFIGYIIVDGFPDTLEHEVKLFSVSRGEKRSEPVTVKFRPLTPPLQEVFNTLVFRETFGGVTVSYQNSGEASMAVSLFTPDEKGEMTEVNTYYSKLKEGHFSARGFVAEKRKFGVVVRDRWGNLSDTAVAEITPIFEELIPKPFKVFNLPTDTYAPHGGSGNTVDKLWDNRLSNFDAPGVAIFHTAPGTGMPQQFTFDLGVRSKLSRFKMHSRGPASESAFQRASPRRWEIWGSNSPDPQGTWTGWELLMVCESVKPSGLPLGTNTADDNYYAVVEGEDFFLPEDAPSVRYLRFKTLETWGYLDYITIAELTFWGRLE